MIRTRFAPSPTGFLHIGGARTALFCYLHARRHGGKYFLRIEDTDRERSTTEAVEAIFEGLSWLGLHHDGEPFFQSQNVDNHIAAALRLVEEGKAYRCYCSKEELDAMREEQREKKIKPRYDGRCRSRGSAPPDLPHVVRFKAPTEGETAWEDLIQGRISWSNQELDDLVLLRSDGSPTYNLAVVVDDHAMGVDLVIRGDDHINNTPRQMQLFAALGHPLPRYAHMPLMHGADGSKLSKRHGAVSLLLYRDEGFLPQALANYLVRLGWSHGEREIFTMAEMTELFDIADVGRSASIFDREKLLWINGHHLRNSDAPALIDPLLPHLARLGVTQVERDYLARILPSLKERAKTLVELAQMARFYLVDEVTPYDPAAVKKHMKADIAPILADLVTSLVGLATWTEQGIEEAFTALLATHDIKMGRIAQPVRIALTGSAVSPGIYEVLFLLGQDKSLRRLRAGIAFLQGV